MSKDETNYNSHPGILECSGVRVRFGENEILHGVDLKVFPGETVALLGGNGSGKTTLVRTLLGLVKYHAGEVRLFGKPLRSVHEWQRVGYVSQRTELAVSNATVYELVSTGRLSTRRWFLPPSQDDREAINHAIAQVKLTHRKKSQVLTLSGGQRQRTQIARALAGEPDVLVLDEPLAGLDITSQLGLARVLADLKKAGLSMLIVLHDLGPLENLIDRAIVLRNGRVIHDGPLASSLSHHDNDCLEEVTVPSPLSPDQLSFPVI